LAATTARMRRCIDKTFREQTSPKKMPEEHHRRLFEP
jgi:hypothetical protein